MTTTAFDDQFTDAPEPVRQQYSTADILRRNVADLELALRTQTERAEAAEAELARLREQKPVRWHVRGNYFHDGDAAILFASMNSMCGARVDQLFAAPVPAPHKGATHCDDCGLTWLDDGLNPLWCPYCKDTVPAPAAPNLVFMAHNKTSNILFAARKDADQYAAAAGPTAGVAITECAVIGSQSAPQAPAVSAANPVQWLEDEGDLIVVPRGLLGAACSSIDKQRPAPKVLEAMRHYTMNAPQAPAVPTDEQIHVVYRNARRYLALRENEITILAAVVKGFDADTYRAEYDAAADRLLEGGK